MRPLSRALIAGGAVLLAGQIVPHPAVARPETRAFFRQTGVASWYGPGFHGRRTASGERFDQNELTAAHRQLPLGTEVTVTNLENGRAITVEINDRGPYVGGRVIDLSRAAAQRLGIVEDGLATVRIEATPRQLASAAR
jgi:rare lipoprotein A